MLEELVIFLREIEMEDFIQEYILPVFFAICGGIADFMQSDNHKIWYLIVAMFLAAFLGCIVLMLCMEYGISERMTGVACGLAGYSSRAVLLLFRKEFIDRIKSRIKKM